MESIFKFTIRYTECHGPKEYMKGARAKKFGANQETTIDEFIEKIRHGYGFITPGIDVELPIELQNKKQDFNYTGLDTFLKSNWLVYDIDNATIDMRSFIKHLPRNFHPTIAYTTESNLKKGKGYRFRLMYIFKSPFISVEEYIAYYKSLEHILQLGAANDTSTENGVQTIFGNPTDNLEIYKHTKLKLYNKSDINVKPLSDSEKNALANSILRAKTKRENKISEALSKHKQCALIADKLVVHNPVSNRVGDSLIENLLRNELKPLFVQSVIELYKDTYGERYITNSADFSDDKHYEQNILIADVSTLYARGLASKEAIWYKNRLVYVRGRKRLLRIWANYFLVLNPNLDLASLTFNLLILFNLHCINSESLLSSYNVHNEIIHGKDLILIAQTALDNKEKNRSMYIDCFKCQKLKFNPKLINEVKEKEGVSGQKAFAILKERYGFKKTLKKNSGQKAHQQPPKPSPELIIELTKLYPSTTIRKRELYINRELEIRGYRKTSRTQIDRILKGNL